MLGIFKKLWVDGFLHIVASGSLNRVLTALLAIILVRILDQEAYGSYAYAQNIMSFFLIVNALGSASATLQICSENQGEKGFQTYRYGLRAGLAIDCLMAFAMLVIGACVPLPVSGSNSLLIMLGAYPLMAFWCEMKLTKLRCERKNRDYAFMTNTQTVLLVLGSLLGAVLFETTGLIAGQYFALVITLLIFHFRFEHLSLLGSAAIDEKSKRGYWAISLVSAFNNSLSQLLSLVGVFLVGVFLQSESETALYKAATMIPYALTFVPSMLVTYLYPLFVAHRCERNWTIRYFLYSTLGVLAIMLSVCVPCILFANPIISLIFGNEYIACSVSFRVLMIGSLVMNSFGRLAGNLLVTQRKLLVNTLIAVACVLVCVESSLCLIPTYGIDGAAVAWSISMVLMAALTFAAYIIVILRIDCSARADREN